MPLWRLQTVGPQRLEFLYDNLGTGATIELRAGVAYYFRKFHGLITDLIKGAWLRYVRRVNATVLRETTDLNRSMTRCSSVGWTPVYCAGERLSVRLRTRLGPL
jgi:hypothetical protein